MASVAPVSFGYNPPITIACKKGLLPTVKFDVYGNWLIKEEATAEHIIPVSLGGKTEEGNIVLANKDANNRRGNKPILMFTTKEAINLYLWQFRGIINEYINGNRYIIAVQKTMKGLYDEYFSKNYPRK